MKDCFAGPARVNSHLRVAGDVWQAHPATNFVAEDTRFRRHEREWPATRWIMRLMSSENASRTATEDLLQLISISHDLWEPLRTVRCTVGLLAQKLYKTGDNATDHLLCSITQGIERMQKTISATLDYSTAGELATDRREINSQESLHAAVSNLQKMMTDTKATITSSSLPMIRASFVGVSQVFQNLLENAIKYRSPHALPRIHVSCARSATAWRFSVSDNGIGIHPRYHDYIFMPTKRLHSSSAVPGTGLGLAICRRIVEAHGGRIWVRSDLGAGSMFCFTIPCSVNNA
jgi:light-regulated signal transduction histidine kinase (bacteriophytochrome)